VEFRLAEVHGQVREALRRSTEHEGESLAEEHQTVDVVLNKWRAHAAAVN
jgi:hypothetical protein